MKQKRKAAVLFKLPLRIMGGDRLDNDIAPANKIGMKTVWIKQGYGGLSKPHSEEEQPDHTVDSLNELIHLFIS